MRAREGERERKEREGGGERNEREGWKWERPSKKVKKTGKWMNIDVMKDIIFKKYDNEGSRYDSRGKLNADIITSLSKWRRQGMLTYTKGIKGEYPKRK